LAKDVLKAPDPLGYLANCEDVYWAIEQYLQQKIRMSNDTKCRILEVGSGLGYLTYAMAKRGHDVVGLDISTESVRRATELYGEMFVCAELADYAEVHKSSFDIIILAELIEHVPDIWGLFANLDKLLKEGGDIVITTPNKTVFGEKAVWKDELPPIHLWWFSETSLLYIAQKLGYDIRFIDFTEYNKTHYINLERKLSTFPIMRPVFSSDGKLLLIKVQKDRLQFIKDGLREILIFRVLNNLRWSILCKWQFFRLKRTNPELLKRRYTLCAILTKGITDAKQGTLF
jgi:SAM-dependent methyltransferase